MRIQEMMVKSLYDVAKQALKEYPDDDPLNR
jgi:dynein heavy chain